MKKLLIITLCLLFAGSVYAVEVEISGDIGVEGKLWDTTNFADKDEFNLPTFDDDDFGSSWYESDANISIKFMVDENTFAAFQFAMFDETWLNASDRNEDATFNDEGQMDDNIALEKAYLSHKFPFESTLSVGAMSSNAWGTAFGDAEGSAYQLKVSHPVQVGSIVGIIQKNRDMGAENGTKDSEEDDNDEFWLGAKLAFGDVNLKPLFVYVLDSSAIPDQGGDGLKTMELHLALDGQMNNFGFEAEVIYTDTSSDAENADSYSLYGIYASIWSSINDNLKIGGWLAYGSVEDGQDTDADGANNLKAFDFGDDFDSALIYGGEISSAVLYEQATNVIERTRNASLGENYDIGGDDLAGVTAVKLYVESGGLFDAITLTTSILYWSSNYSDWDSNGMEVDIEATYAITEALTYSIGIGYATINIDDLWEDAPSYLLVNALSLEF